MKKFLGNELMTVDDKGRLGIPAKFMTVLRKICPDQAGQVGVMITPDRSIKIMPVPAFEEKIEELAQLDDQLEEDRLVLTLSTSMAECLKLDKQNRVKLSPMLLEICGIGRQAMVVGNIDAIQVFDRAVWQDLVAKGMANYSGALSRVARKGEVKAPVQYVINTPGAPGAGDDSTQS